MRSGAFSENYYFFDWAHMMGTHEAHLLMISQKKADFQMMGGLCGEVSKLSYLAQETFINDTIVPYKGNCDGTHRGSPMLYRHQQICPILGDVSKS